LAAQIPGAPDALDKRITNIVFDFGGEAMQVSGVG